MCIIQFFSAVLTPLIAIIAVYIAYQQYITNKRNVEQQNYINARKLKFELYEKRFKIFEDTKQILLKIYQKSGLELNELQLFKTNTKEVYFLFNEDIVKFLEDIGEKNIELNGINLESDDKSKLLSNSPVRIEISNRKSILLKWFFDNLLHIELKFINYLDFREL